MRKFIKELSVLMRVRHPNLLLLMGVSLDGPNLCVVTEYMSNNTLFYVLHKDKTLKLNLVDRLKIAIQIARGVIYLHQNDPPLIHRDLKPENCLLDSSFNIKIADFGLARPISFLDRKKMQNNFENSNEIQDNTTLCIGTTRFMAPELFDSEMIYQVGVEIDVWAFGCLMIEIFSNKRP